MATDGAPDLDGASRIHPHSLPAGNAGAHAWCEGLYIALIGDVQPMHVAACIGQMQAVCPAPTVSGSHRQGSATVMSFEDTSAFLKKYQHVG